VLIRAASVCKKNGHAKACVSKSHSRELLEWADSHALGAYHVDIALPASEQMKQ
jgi:hypothetical protein